MKYQFLRFLLNSWTTPKVNNLSEWFDVFIQCYTIHRSRYVFAIMCCTIPLLCSPPPLRLGHWCTLDTFFYFSRESQVTGTPQITLFCLDIISSFVVIWICCWFVVAFYAMKLNSCPFILFFISLLFRHYEDFETRVPRKEMLELQVCSFGLS